MARNSIVIHAPPEDVYAVLSDADSYARWVVGSKEIRGTDRDWPRPGGRFHHTVGAGPARIEDDSEVTRAEPGRRLELEVRFRPAGTAHVTIELEPEAGARATALTMTEVPTGGPPLRVWRLALDAVTHLRNTESLRRLRRIVEARSARA